MSSKPYRHFIFWFILQLGFVIYAMQYGLDAIFIAIEVDKTNTMIILAALFLIMYGKNIFDTIQQKKDCDDLKALQDHLEKKTHLEDDFMGLNVLPHGKVREAMELLNSQALVKNVQSIDLDLVLNSWATSIESRYEFLKHGAGVVITTGLIGTMIGLIMTMGGLEGVMLALGQDQASDDLLENLSKTLGGMSTAFYTTLFGAILGGALLKTLALITYNASVSNVHALSYLLQTHVLTQLSHNETLPSTHVQMTSILKKMDQMISEIKASGPSHYED